MTYIQSKTKCEKKEEIAFKKCFTMLATSKNVLFPGHNHLLTNSTDNLAL